MNENVFWIYNGWAVLITALGPIYTIIDAELRQRGIFLLRSLSPFFYLASIVLLFVTSGWIPALLYIPALILGLVIASTIKNR